MATATIALFYCSYCAHCSPQRWLAQSARRGPGGAIWWGFGDRLVIVCVVLSSVPADTLANLHVFPLVLMPFLSRISCHRAIAWWVLVAALWSCVHLLLPLDALLACCCRCLLLPILLETQNTLPLLSLRVRSAGLARSYDSRSPCFGFSKSPSLCSTTSRIDHRWGGAQICWDHSRWERTSLTKGM